MHGTRTGARKYPGVERLDDGRYRIRGKWRCAKTGRVRELDRIVDATSAEQASAMRTRLRNELRASEDGLERRRLDDFATSWLRSRTRSVKGSTARHYAETLDRYIAPALGDHYVDAITRADVERWFSAQSGTPQTRNGRLAVLRMVLDDACAELGIANPAARVARCRVVVDEDTTKVIAPEDVARLLAWIQDHAPRYHDIALTLALTGMRYGEAAALRWSDVDEARGTIRISRRFYRGSLDTPKNGRARTVPLPPMLADALRERRARMVREQAPGLAEGWVFPSPQTGEPVRQVGFAAVLRRAGAALGLDPAPTPHSFRYSLNDALRRVGASGEVARAIVGHSSAAMTEHYSHVGLEERRAAVAAAVVMLAPRGEGGDPGGDRAGSRRGDGRVKP